MATVRLLRPLEVFDADTWRDVTRVSRWRGAWLVAHAWGVVLLAAGLASWWDHWAGWLAAVIVIGGRQLGLAILMHDAAHGLLSPHRRWNNFLGQWVTGAAVGTDLFAYRTYHLSHHRHVQQPEDPDLSLSAPFPVTRASLLRKVIRDLTGQTFVKQRYAQIAMAVRAYRLRGTAGGKATDVFVGRALLRFAAVQGVLLALSLVSLGWTPFLLWLAALATTFPLFLRIRNIAEHACTATGSDDPFSHARTTHASGLARVTVAPYWVNYHSEHHLFMGVPCYRLPAVHRALGQRGDHRRMILAPSYAAVLRLVTTPRAALSQPAS